MCRLLGITNFNYLKHQKIINNFCDLARTGTVLAGDSPGHEDGWGLAFYDNGKLVVHKSGLNILDEQEPFLDILEKAGDSPIMILHLRKSAWSNTTSTRHAHPFDYENRVFAHNGTVYDYKGLLKDITIPGLREDALDTEVFFLHFLSSDVADLGSAFLKTVALIKNTHSYSALNCLFSDGEKMYAYRDFSKEPDYYSLFKTQSENSVIIASQPLSSSLLWKQMDKEEFYVITA